MKAFAEQCLFIATGIGLAAVCLIDEFRPKPKIFKYQFHQLEMQADGKNYELDAKTMGKWGWELVQLSQEGKYWLLIFKKETK